MVGGDIGLALGGVEDQGIHLAGGLLQLFPGGPGAASHADYAGLRHPLHQLLQGDLLGLQRLRPALPGRVLAVVVNDNGRAAAAPGVGAVLNPSHLP